MGTAAAYGAQCATTDTLLNRTAPDQHHRARAPTSLEYLPLQCCNQRLLPPEDICCCYGQNDVCLPPWPPHRLPPAHTPVEGLLLIMGQCQGQVDIRYDCSGC